MIFDREQKEAIKKSLYEDLNYMGARWQPVFSIEGENPNNKTEYLTAMKSWVFACVRAKADEICKTEFSLHRLKADNSIEEVEDHPILDLFYRPNPNMTKADLLWLVSAYLDLQGEAPLMISVADGVVNGLYPLRPDRLDVKVNKFISKDSPANISGFVYRTEKGGKIEFEPEEILFLRTVDPLTIYRGLSTVGASEKTIDIDTFSESWNRKFFFNSARPDMVLTSKKTLTKGQKEDIKNQIRQIYGGMDNSHKAMVLDSEMDLKPFTLNQRDMDFMEQQKFTRDKILAIFGVPRTVIGITDDVNRANAEATDYVFAKRTIEPILTKIFEQINEFLIPLMSDEYLFLSYDDIIPKDEERIVRVQQLQISGGIKTINEIRTENGDEDIGEPGDVVYISSTLVPITDDFLEPKPIPPQLANAQKPEVPPEKPPTKSFRFFKKYAVNRKNFMERDEKEIAEQLYPKILKDLQAKQVVKKKPIPVKKKDIIALSNKEFWNVQVKTSERYERLLQRRLNAWFIRQRRIVLDKFPSRKKAFNPGKFVLDVLDETKYYITLVSPLAKKLMIEQGKVGMRQTRVDKPFTFNEALETILLDRTTKVGSGATKVTNEGITATLKEGMENEESIPQLRKRVETYFDDIEKYRSERIARTETIKFSNSATEEAYRQSGVVAKKEWLTAFDERTCEWCEEMNGKIVGLDDTYFNEGDTLTGNQGGKLDLDFEDVEYPPLHANCRCTIIPVFNKDASKLIQIKENELDKAIMEHKKDKEITEEKKGILAKIVEENKLKTKQNEEKEKELEDKELGIDEQIEKVKKLNDKAKKLINEE